eukprot:365686-Chlamydomonas_euryale.AAC.6
MVCWCAAHPAAKWRAGADAEADHTRVRHGVRAVQCASCTVCVQYSVRPARCACGTVCVRHGVRAVQCASCTVCVRYSVRAARCACWKEGMA